MAGRFAVMFIGLALVAFGLVTLMSALFGHASTPGVVGGVVCVVVGFVMGEKASSRR